MKKFISIFLTVLCLCGLANADTFYTWRYRTHATDCTSLTDGRSSDICYEEDSHDLYKCVPTTSGGICDTSAEWEQVYAQPDNTITNSETSYALYINQTGVLASGYPSTYIYSNAIQTSAELLKVYSDNSSSSYRLANFINDGTGSNLVVEQSGVLGSSNRALNIYSSSAQTATTFGVISLSNASSTSKILTLENAGTGSGLYIDAKGVLASSNWGLYVKSDANQTAQPLVSFVSGGASGNKPTLELSSAAAVGASSGLLNIGHSSTGNVIFIDKNNSGYAINIDADANDANVLVGINIDLANAGAGQEYAFQFGGSAADATSGGGTKAGRIPIYANGGIKYIYFYSD